MHPIDIIENIARHGIERSEAHLADLARQAARCGVLPAIASILTDRSAPPVVRERAAARIAVELAAQPVRLHYLAA